MNVWPDFGFEDDSSVVDESIIYKGNYEQLNVAGLGDVLLEVIAKAYRKVEADLGFPCVHFFVKSELERWRRGLATV